MLQLLTPSALRLSCAARYQRFTRRASRRGDARGDESTAQTGALATTLHLDAKQIVSSSVILRATWTGGSRRVPSDSGIVCNPLLD
jgi:hypothetical protein